ncbi:MAG: hypothetical protein J6Q42_02805 [Clostridia bacterium]|nr:hypothetical protein [Clostridia bacterium]
MKRIANVLNIIFGIGTMLTLFLGGLTVLGYVVALFIGGETATEICAFIYKTFFPYLIRATSVFVGCGLIGMYLEKKKALTMVQDTEEK